MHSNHTSIIWQTFCSHYSLPKGLIYDSSRVSIAEATLQPKHVNYPHTASDTPLNTSYNIYDAVQNIKN